MLGDVVGSVDGLEEGEAVGIAEGFVLGRLVLGEVEGLEVGIEEGRLVLGELEGAALGEAVASARAMRHKISVRGDSREFPPITKII